MNDDKKKAVQLLKTARGQIDGIIKMIEDERYCIDVSNQIMASQALVKKANKYILSQHLNSCVIAAMDNAEAKEEKIQELDKIISKLLESK
ncbi:MAG: metal-sensing transcriptional repressor [Sarcina sp.]